MSTFEDFNNRNVDQIVRDALRVYKKHSQIIRAARSEVAELQRLEGNVGFENLNVSMRVLALKTQIANSSAQKRAVRSIMDTYLDRKMNEMRAPLKTSHWSKNWTAEDEARWQSECEESDARKRGYIRVGSHALG